MIAGVNRVKPGRRKDEESLFAAGVDLVTCLAQTQSSLLCPLLGPARLTAFHSSLLSSRVACTPNPTDVTEGRARLDEPVNATNDVHANRN